MCAGRWMGGWVGTFKAVGFIQTLTLMQRRKAASKAPLPQAHTHTAEGCLHKKERDWTVSLGGDEAFPFALTSGQRIRCGRRGGGPPGRRAPD